mmetsp:Transcript_28640/g.78727  ORF Transcript_28640/g.78727 Transcript_28640/m.78727 type:complete len:231 (+) Transcript_28640:71-763(+)
MSWLRSIIQPVCNLLADDGEDPDLTLARVIGGNVGKNDENPYEELARVDQVVHFFEYEAPALEGFIAEDATFAEELERQRVSYYNMVNSVEVQNQRIMFHVDELLRLRSELKGQRHQPGTPSRQETLVEIARVKMDISDVKSKRYFKERTRKEAMAEIVPMIVKVKTERLLAERAFEHKEASHAGDENANEYSSVAEQETMSLLPKANGATRRRRPYTDKELNNLLKGSD